MKIENMEKAVKDRWKSKGDFIYQCITNDHQWDCPGSAAVYEGHWSAASTFNGFLKAVQMDERLMYTSQAYGEIGRLDRWPIKVKPGCLIDSFTVGSDAGSVKLGDVAGTCGFMVPNGFGDGSHGVAIVERRGFNEHAMRFITSVEGRFQIYTYDCADLAPAGPDAKIIEGRYGVYAQDGTVFFEKWS